MDSSTSGTSMQSSSGCGCGGGGGDEEFSSHPHEYISSFLTFAPPPPPPPPPNSTPFDPFSSFLNPFPPSSNPSNLTPPARADVAGLTADFHPQPPQPPSTTTSLPSNTVAVQQAPAPRGGSRKRPRASRKPPTTVLTTDASNFRAMVQEFTGFPTPPFAASSSSPFVRPRLGLLRPPATATAAAPPPPYLLRPSPQKVGSSSSLSSEQQQRQRQQQQQQHVQQQTNLLEAPIFGNLAFQSPVFFEKQQQRAHTTELIAGDDGLANWIDYDGLDLQVQTQAQTQSLLGTDVGGYGNSQGVDYISRLSSSTTATTTTEIGSFRVADKGVGLLSHVDVNGRR